LQQNPHFPRKIACFPAKFEAVFGGSVQIIKISRVWAGNGACSAQGGIALANPSPKLCVDVFQELHKKARYGEV
jgi:hypothetical protein